MQRQFLFATSSSIYDNSKLCPNIHKFLIGLDILDFMLAYCISQSYLEKQNYLYTLFLSYLSVFISLCHCFPVSTCFCLSVYVCFSVFSLSHTRDTQIHTCAHICTHRNCIDLAFMTEILEINMTFSTPKGQKTQSNLSREAAGNGKPRWAPRITDNTSSLEDQENGIWWHWSIAASRIDKLAQNNGKECILLFSDLLKMSFVFWKMHPTHTCT